MRKVFAWLKDRRGSEVIQLLIVLAIMGAIALGVTRDIGSALIQANNDVVDQINQYVSDTLSTGFENGGSTN